MGVSRGTKQKRLLLLYTVFLFLIILTGCAKKEAIKSLSDEEVLREKVVTYWNHVIAEEYDKNYQTEDPLYRKAVSIVAYIKSFSSEAIKYLRYEIGDIRMNDNDTAEVVVKTAVRLKVPGAKAFERDTELTEQWAKIDGEWYHVPKAKKRLNQ